MYNRINPRKGSGFIKKLLAVLFVLLAAFFGVLAFLAIDIDNTLTTVRALIGQPAVPLADPARSLSAEQEPASSLPDSSASSQPESSAPEPDNGKDEPDRYIYRQLNESQQAVYRAIYGALLDCAESVMIPAEHVGALGEFELIDLFDGVLDDYPEIFWADNEIVVRTQTSPLRSDLPLELQFRYVFQGAQLERVQSEIDTYTADCLAGAPWDGQEFDKILYLYEYIIDNTEYDLEAAYNQNITSVMLNGESVCKGYAKTFQYLANQMEIPCVTVNGYAQGQGAHSWNLILADGEYYYLDVTWGDPEMDASTMLFDNIKYDYFMLPWEEISLTHTPAVKYTLPRCDETRMNYYHYTGRMFDDYHADRILEVTAADVGAGLDKTSFRFSSQSVYDAALASLFEGGDAFTILSGAGSGVPYGESLSYLLNDTLRIVTLVFP